MRVACTDVTSAAIVVVLQRTFCAKNACSSTRTSSSRPPRSFGCTVSAPFPPVGPHAQAGRVDCIAAHSSTELLGRRRPLMKSGRRHAHRTRSRRVGAVRLTPGSVSARPRDPPRGSGQSPVRAPPAAHSDPAIDHLQSSQAPRPALKESWERCSISSLVITNF
ncbi:hypothetical protein HPB47_011981 [Ixodes persulcatus]|uniref:Uncharacterized protein n=1 Tax=Ixodes persulcatus TaxID=34615 RepID=A0AC60NUX6_IXOPE|nr:hypothetical protein HPB47_011981 [Ixodes persulcatus]